MKQKKRGVSSFRTWIEIDQAAFRQNYREFLRIIPRGTKFMAVIKSNAYGHGLVQTARIFSSFPEFSKRGWFGVDSIVEANRLRREGIKVPILVLGSTLLSRISDAYKQNIAITVSNFETLEELGYARRRPKFHIKIDTGMHRQGFFPSDVPKLLELLKHFKLRPEGVYTHFASAKDKANSRYTTKQFSEFKKVLKEFENMGFNPLVRHASASAGTLVFPASHLDMVRIGMGIYGYFPSDEIKKDSEKEVKLKPVLSWKTRIAEVKTVPAGAYIGYDGTERTKRATRVAVLPVGYWHGYDRGLSSIGQVLIGGRRCRVLGRVSMDMVVVDISAAPKVKVGDEAVLIGRQGQNEIWADEVGRRIGTTKYEILTRTNPLIERVIT